MKVILNARVCALAHFSDRVDPNLVILNCVFPALNSNDKTGNVHKSVERSRKGLRGMVASAEDKNAWIHTSSLPYSFTT
jgi:hypothetical protein